MKSRWWSVAFTVCPVVVTVDLTRTRIFIALQILLYVLVIISLTVVLDYTILFYSKYHSQVLQAKYKLETILEKLILTAIDVQLKNTFLSVVQVTIFYIYLKFNPTEIVSCLKHSSQSLGSFPSQYTAPSRRFQLQQSFHFQGLFQFGGKTRNLNIYSRQRSKFRFP